MTSGVRKVCVGLGFVDSCCCLLHIFDGTQRGGHCEANKHSENCYCFTRREVNVKLKSSVGSKRLSVEPFVNKGTE